MQIVRFGLGGQLLAFPVESVREVVTSTHFSAVFHAPPFVRGLINVRGEAVPVFDPGVLFDLPDSGSGEEEVVVLIEDGGLTAGILAQRPVDIRDLADDELSEATKAAPNIEAIRHVAQLDEGLVLILDAHRLFQHDSVRALRDDGDLLQIR